jgi:GNAT superfamily N-acetyltransferase
MPVRSATSADCPAITSAYLTSWRAGYRDLLTEADLEAQAALRRGKDWQATIALSDREVFVAEVDDHIVGVAECEHQPEQGRLPWLQMLYVVPSAWGTGVAVELLRESVAAVHKAGHRSIWLEVVDPQARARRFYEREGFVRDRSMPPGSNGLFQLIYYRHDQQVP